ncbi:MAG: MATE family efflux transporter [Aristaeellaceae bacterium]
MARSTVRDLTVGSPFKLVVSFTVPLLFGFLFQQLYSFVDTALVGRYLGSEALAAVGSTGSLNFLILGFCMGICSGCSIPVAQAFGARDETELRRYVVHCVYLGAAVSLVMGGVTTLLCPQMLQATNTPADIMDGALSYIRPVFAAIPIMMLYNMASGIMRSLGDSKTPVYFLAMASIINIALDLLFILVFQLGVAGAALATIISQLASGVGCVIMLVRRFPILRMQKGDFRFRPQLAGRLLGMGVPMGLQFSITAVGSVIMQTAVNGLGTVAVAAIAAGGKLFSFFSCVFDALATTMATFAGQNIGARKLQRVHQGVKAANILGAVYSVVVFLLMVTWGKPMLGMFVDQGDVQVIGQAYRYMVVNTAFFLLLLFVNVFRLTIQGMGFTRIAMIAGVMEMIARTAVAMVLVPLLGFNGACWSNPMAWLLADVFLIPCYLHITRKLKNRLRPAGENV